MEKKTSEDQCRNGEDGLRGSWNVDSDVAHLEMVQVAETCRSVDTVRLFLNSVYHICIMFDLTDIITITRLRIML